MDLSNPTQEVELVDQETGNKAKPTAQGALPVVVTDLTGTPVYGAKEDGNLLSIKNQTDKLVFTGDSLKVAAQLSATAVGLNNAADARINPATEESLAKLTIAQGATLGTNTQALVGAAVAPAALPTHTVGTIQPLSVDFVGQLRVTNTDWLPMYTFRGLAFGAQADGIALPTSGVYNPLALLRNPTGSGRTIVLTKIAILSETAAKSAKVEFRVAPTVTTAGTAMTGGNLQVGNATTPVALAYTLPAMTGGIAVWERLATDLGFTADIDGRIQILPGFDLGIFGMPATNNLPVAYAINWIEVL